MYTRKQAALIRQKFWTQFGKYMAPVPSAEGKKINWINYNTGIPNIYFRMNAGNEQAYIGIEIMHNPAELAKKYFKQFILLKPALQEYMVENPEFETLHINEFNQPMCRIYSILQPVNIFNESDWPAIISFLKQKITGLDNFWTDHKIIFESAG